MSRTLKRALYDCRRLGPPTPRRLKRALYGGRLTSDAHRVADEIPYVGQASPPDGEFVEIAAGYWHTCGLHADGSVECWGSGDPGDPVDVNGVHQGQSDPPEL